MQIKYYRTALNDLRNTKGWFKKLLLLALLNLIPIFGQIVTFGYLYGWAREIAWGVNNPLPDRILGNEDGKLYRRGFFALVITFVFSLAPGVVDFFSELLTGGGVLGFSQLFSEGARQAASVPGAFALTLGSLLGIVSFVLQFAVVMLGWVAIMRMSIYDDLGAGFQITTIWKMACRDVSGLFKILGMCVLIGAIIGILFTIAFSLVTIVIFAGALAVSADITTESQAIATVLGAGLIGIPIFLLLAYFLMVGIVYVEALATRAVGYWTYQFNVPQWRGKDDPLPFEYQAPMGQYPPQQY